nr:uncharacterized protein LOC112019593 [Quercus suber]POF16306.1 hypothetical protein CFP56_23824 [Quercus suber]
MVQPMLARVSDIQQSSQTRPQLSAQLWPKQKRPAISEVAVKWLMSLPENKGKILYAADVLKVLDGNPSYAQLCAGLQNLGAKFDQSSLARVILRGLPELVPTKTTGSEQPRSVVNNSRARLSVEPASATSLQRHGTSLNYKTPNLASVNGPSNTNAGESSAPGDTVLQNARLDSLTQVSVPLPGTPSLDRPPANSGPSAVESKPAPPVSIRPPANKEEAARKRKITDLVDLTTSDSDDEGPPLKRVALTPGPGSGVSTHYPPGSQGPPISRFAPGSSLQAPDSNGLGMFVASQYNATGPKPARSQITHLPPQSTPTQGRTPEQLQQERMKGKMLVEPIMRDRVARKSHYNSRTIARDVLLATGRHPDMKPLNQHLIVMSKLLSDHGAQQEMDGSRGLRSDLATIRWDIIDPGRSSSFEATSAQADVKGHADPLDQTNSNDTTDETHIVKAHDPTKRALSTIAHVDVPKRKVGRPRKQDKQQLVFVNNGPGSGGDTAVAGQAASTTAAAQTAVPTTEADTSLHSASPVAMSAPGGTIGYTAFRKYDEHGNIIKTKGRPKGWKKSLHSREALGLETSAKKKPAVEKHMAIPQPQVFKCEWRSCPAELHNLETLKKHVVKLHDEENDAGQYACRWKDCSINKLLPDFQSWTEHIYEAHMDPVAWNKGDGPGGGLPGHGRADSESYLSDAHGRSVTPVITPRDSLAESTSGATVAASLKVLIDHKSIVGPSFEKTGCTLANAKRRRGFLDDEDFEHHYEEDDARF